MKFCKLASLRRGKTLQKKHIKQILQTPEDVTIKTYKEILKKDSIGRLLAELNLEEIKEQI